MIRREVALPGARRRRADPLGELRLGRLVRVLDDHHLRIDRQPVAADITARDLREQLRRVDDRSRAEHQLGLARLRAGRQAEMGEDLARGEIHLVRGVGTADADQQVVLGREVEGDVAFALGAVLAADDDIHARGMLTVEQSELGGNAHDDVVGTVAIGVDRRRRPSGRACPPAPRSDPTSPPRRWRPPPRRLRDRRCS